jgi:hypothetical protein
MKKIAIAEHKCNGNCKKFIHKYKYYRETNKFVLLSAPNYEFGGRKEYKSYIPVRRIWE